mmetsp:Transcript_5497/g.13290  ORF Transcript_5497/g.13290 Transcript_5497/m.13290 type:complete len:231 (+) Transcript_5497:492-1184(+)
MSPCRLVHFCFAFVSASFPPSSVTVLTTVRVRAHSRLPGPLYPALGEDGGAIGILMPPDPLPCFGVGAPDLLAVGDSSVVHDLIEAVFRFVPAMLARRFRYGVSPAFFLLADDEARENPSAEPVGVRFGEGMLAGVHGERATVVSDCEIKELEEPHVADTDAKGLRPFSTSVPSIALSSAAFSSAGGAGLFTGGAGLFAVAIGEMFGRCSVLSSFCVGRCCTAFGGPCCW